MNKARRHKRRKERRWRGIPIDHPVRLLRAGVYYRIWVDPLEAFRTYEG